MKNKNLFRTRWLQVAICTVILIFTPIGNVWANYVYFDPSANTNWYNDGAKFTVSFSNPSCDFCDCEEVNGTTGVWRFNVGDRSGTAYFKRRPKDACNGNWNEVSGTVSESQNVMHITSGFTGSMQTSFVINYIHGTNHIYFDNTTSNFSGNIYFVIGHDVDVHGSSDTYSIAYPLTLVTGTNLYHAEITATWQDATYYAIVASTSSISGNAWGSSSLSTKGDKGYTAAYKKVYNMEGGTFLITTASSGDNKAMTITYYDGYSNLPKLEATQAAKKRDTGSSYSNFSGSWPATLQLQGAYMSSASEATRSTITSTASTDARVNKTYEAIKTGTITHSYKSLSSSYYFEGWGTGTTPSKTDATYEYNITEATTVYAFFSMKYTLTYDEKGTTGSSTLSVTSVSGFSGATTSGSSIPTGHSIELTASPATGYRLTSPQAWYSDASCTESLGNGTSTTYTISSLNENRAVYATFELIPYTITYNLNGGTNHEDNPSGYNVTTATITLQAPSRDNYTFEGWYDNSSFTGSAVTSIPLGSTGNKELWAKWSETPYTITPSVTPVGSGSVNIVTDAKIVTPSSNITATPENVAWRFKTWAMGANVTLASTYSLTDATIKVNATANSTVTATFEPRYELNGSLNEGGDPVGGMPGWSYPIAAASFDVISFDGIGDGVGNGVDLEYSCLLQPNKQYKFRVYDRESGDRWGLSSAAVIPAEGVESNKKLTIFGEEGCGNVLLNTVGYGTYTFKITNMYDNGDGKYYPAIEVSRPASSQLTMEWKHYTNGTLSDGNTGGTVTAATNEGSGYDITNGQFYANGSNLTFTASPATGYHVEGWYSDARYSSAYKSGEGGATISGEGDVTLELASVSTNKTVYVKFTEDTKEAASGDGDWSAKVGDSKITDVVTISSTITVDVDHALAKRVILDQSGGKAGKLVITANKGLEVAEGIWVNKGSGPVAPTAEDLVLESSASGNATLIFNNSNSAAATVQMYSKSVIAGENTWNWQYIGSPYVSASALHNYYGCYLKKWGDPAVGWNDVANGASVEPWKAYSVTQESTSTFVMEGTLVPTDNIVELDIPDKPSWIVANSWTAPIYIDAMDGAFDEETEKTVYLFNTGFAPNGAGTATTGTEESRYAAGTYLSVPVNSAVSMGNPFISSMQGFVVKNTTDPRKAIKLTLNYSTMVRPTIDRGIAGGKMHAPKNIQEDEQPTVLKMLARGTNYDDCLYLLERADFTTGFDNGWDGSKLGDNAVAPRLYTTREDGTKESVSAVPELEGSILTFRAGEDNVYTFQFEYSEEAETLYLLDLDKNIYTRVLTGSTYTFTTNDKAEHPRFILTRYGAPQITTGVDEVYNANSARKQMINGTLYIIRDGRIYNAEGTLVK